MNYLVIFKNFTRDTCFQSLDYGRTLTISNQFFFQTITIIIQVFTSTEQSIQQSPTITDERLTQVPTSTDQPLTSRCDQTLGRHHHIWL
jgi:hypothetical protein